MARWARRAVAVLLQLGGLMLLAAPVALAHGALDADIGPPLALGVVIFASSFLVMLLAPADLLGLPEDEYPTYGRMRR